MGRFEVSRLHGNDPFPTRGEGPGKSPFPLDGATESLSGLIPVSHQGQGAAKVPSREGARQKSLPP